ncbi:hypothetical protein [Crucivirus-349]|nr:hypothetical protein [Crucivirus-349]
MSAFYLLNTPSNGVYFGSSRTMSFDSIGLTVSTDTITFPLGLWGYYYVNWVVYGGSTTVIAPSVTYTNCNTVSRFNNFSVNYITNSGATDSKLIYCFQIYIPSPVSQASVGFSSGLMSISTTTGDLFVTEYDP